MMYHSVINPHSYHGYQGNTEDRIIPIKIGCSERSDRSDWPLFTRRNEALRNQGSSVQTEKSSFDPKRNVTITKGLEDTTYTSVFRPPTMNQLNQNFEMKVSTKLLPHQNNYVRESVPRRNAPSTAQSMRSTYFANFSRDEDLHTNRPSTSGTLTDFNRRKWHLIEDFKPNAARKTTHEDVKRQSQSHKDIVVASAVGSVRDQRSDGRVNIREGFIDNTTYKRDFGKRGELPGNRVPVNQGTIGEKLSQFSTTSDLSRGTSKNTNYSLMYMGHIPTHPRNRGTMFDEKYDTTRAHSKDCLRYTIEQNLPGYMGHKPHSVHNDKGPIRTTNKTTSSEIFKDHQVTLMDQEKPHAKRKWMLSNFFSAPTGETALNAPDGITDAEKFYQNYRPKEALPKLGMKSDHPWISEVDLKRTYIFQN